MFQQIFRSEICEVEKCQKISATGNYVILSFVYIGRNISKINGIRKIINSILNVNIHSQFNI